MTRDEAIKTVRQSSLANNSDTLMRTAPDLVDALIALDLLKVEKPVDLQTEVHQRLQNIMTETTAGKTIHVGRLSSYGAGCIVDGLEAAGLKIVRKDATE